MAHSPRTYSFNHYQLPFLLWAILIFVSSSIPGRIIPTINFPNADKIVHFIIFMVFCALTDRAIRFQDRFPLLAKYHLIFSVVITVFYGIIDEGHQLFVPNRDASLADLSADAVGASLYVGLFWIWHFARKTEVSSDSDER